MRGRLYNPAMRAGMYCRVSTTDEDQDSSLINQEQMNRAYIASRGWTEAPDAIYSDRQTGTTLKRAGLLRAVADMRAGKFDVLVAKDLSRFARVVNFMEFLKTEIQAHGGNIAIISEGLDTTSALGRMVVTILLAVYQAFAERTGELVKATKALKKSRGEHTGYWPWGVTRDGSAIEADKEPIIREMVLALQQRPASAIALSLNERGVAGLRGGKWTSTGVLRIARHPVVRALLPDLAEVTVKKPGRQQQSGKSFLLHRLIYNDLLIYEPHMLLQGNVEMAGQPGEFDSYKAYLPGHVADRPSYTMLPCPGTPARSIPMQQLDDLVLGALTDELGKLNLADLAQQVAQQRQAASSHFEVQAAAARGQILILRRTLAEKLKLVDAALAAGLATRAQELDVDAEAVRAQIGHWEDAALASELEASAQREIDADFAAALAQIDLVPELRQRGEWGVLRRIVRAAVREVRCELYRLPGSNKLHGEVRIIWKDVFDLPEAVRNDSLCVLKESILLVA